jgi:transcriptional regulator with PAS, ATPase and Fis domain
MFDRWLPSDKAIFVLRLSEASVKLALRDAEGNKTRAAKELGIARRSLYRMLENISSGS